MARGRPDLDFRLLPKQVEFFEALERHRHVGYIGAAGCGKTEVISLAALALCGANVGLPGMVVEPTLEMSRKIFQPTFRRVCDDYEIPYEYHARDNLFTLPLWDAQVFCASGENPERLRGPNLAWLEIDEVTLQREEVFLVGQGRVRHPKAKKRRLVVAGTPRGRNWAYELFAEPDGKRRAPDSALVRATIFDNPFITENDPSYVSSMRATYDAQLFAQEAMGEFVNFGSQTYFAFQRGGALEIGKKDDLWTGTWRKGGNLGKFEPADAIPLIVTCNFNRTPMSWAMLQCRGRGHPVFVVDEISISGTDTNGACSELLSRWGDHPAGIRAAYGNASGHNKGTRSNYSDYDIIRDRLHVVARAPTVNLGERDRVNAVNAKLRNAKGEVGLYINEERCPRLVKDLETVENVEGELRINRDVDPNLGFMSDALGYYMHLEFPVHVQLVAGRS